VTPVRAPKESPAGAVRVVVMGDIRLYREGLRDLLARQERLDVLGEAADSESGIACARELRPDVVLIDLAMAGSLTTIRALAAADPAVRVVALAVPDVERTVIDCAEAGVAGCLTREASLADVVAAVESAARGEALCSPAVASALFRRVAALAADRAPATPALTAREVEIAALIDEGLSNKEIAQRLRIEVATVKNHVHNILEKLNVRRRAEAAVRARPQVQRRTQRGDPALRD
jgi:two-component system, NarL family, nitrate/nitrite response regulator NarL